MMCRQEASRNGGNVWTAELKSVDRIKEINLLDAIGAVFFLFYLFLVERKGGEIVRPPKFFYFVFNSSTSYACRCSCWQASLNINSRRLLCGF